MSQAINRKRNPGFILKFLAFVVLGAVAVFELQPWLDMATIAVEKITTIPFYGFIRSIPVVGQLFGWIVQRSNIASFLALGFWLLVNWAQVRSWATPVDIKKDPTLWFQVWTTRLISLGIQIVVSFLASPPYYGGWDSLSIDLPFVNLALVEWDALVLFVLFLYSFEFTCIIIDKSLEWNPIVDGFSNRSREGSRGG